MRVTEIMTTDVVTVAPETPVNEIAKLLANQGLSGVPVVDSRTGDLVGMVTELEMIERQAEYDAPFYATFLDAFVMIAERDGEEKLARILATRADQLMERTVYAIRDDATIEEVASLMFERKVNPVPVLARDGTLVGIVSRSDIVKLMARDFTDDADDTTTSSSDGPVAQPRGQASGND